MIPEDVVNVRFHKPKDESGLVLILIIIQSMSSLHLARGKQPRYADKHLLAVTLLKPKDKFNLVPILI